MQNLHPPIVLDCPATRLLRRSAWLARLCLLTIGAVGPVTSTALAQAESTETQCEKVSGAFATNFISQDQTAGTATGDLKGALGVKVIRTVSGTIGDGKTVVLKVQHFWVTETGDTIFTEETDVTAYPGASPSQPQLASFVYEKGVKVIGGTGKFEGATGTTKCWGAIDLGLGQAVGRYSGTICFKVPAATPKVAASSIQDGQFRFQVQASGTGEVVAETSSNLKDWETFAAKTPVNGVAEFNDTSVTTQSQRFYRAKGE